KIDDGKLRHEVRNIDALRADEQLTDEKRMPGELGKDASFDLIFRIGATVEILSKKFLAFGVLEKIGKQVVEILFRHFPIPVPPHRIPGEIVDNGMFVLGAAAGVMAGLRAERTAVHYGSLSRPDGVLVEQRLGQVPVDCGEIPEAEF